MKTVVFENCLNITGHRIPYAGLVATALHESGHEVMVCLPSQLRSQQSRLAEYIDANIALEFFDADPSKTGVLKVLEARSNLLRTTKSLRPEYLAIPTADGIAASFAGHALIPRSSAISDTRIDICLMRAPIGNFLKWNAIKMGPWQRILLIDPRVWENHLSEVNGRFHLCPDPVPVQRFHDQGAARGILGLPATKKIIASVGPQTIRKGTDRLIRAFLEGPPENTVLVLVGKISGEIQSILDTLSAGEKNNLLVVDRFVSDDEFQLAIVASDVIAVPYRDVDRPSGIVSRCICWQRPIIATNRGWLKWAVETFDAGRTVCTENRVEFGRALRQMVDESIDFKVSEKSIEFAKFNSEANYKEIWKSGPGFAK